MLDLVSLAPQVREFIAQQCEALPDKAMAAEAAAAAFEATLQDAENLAAKVHALRSSRLIAQPIPSLSEPESAPNRPTKSTVAAVDGSQIAADRHEFAACFLLNVSSVVLHYGTDEKPVMRSTPKLYFSEEDLYEEEEGELRSISPSGLAERRQREETITMTSLINDLRVCEHPVLALMDGTLILWSLEAESAVKRRAAIRVFETLLDTARQFRIPVAGYISRPGSRDVTNLLRAQLCGFDKAACGLQCTSRNMLKKGAPCEELAEITDRTLFSKLLKPGWRSPVYMSRSKVLHDLAPHNRIAFFYVHVGSEVARVEVPYWVADDGELLDRAHALVCDQAIKGQGYPRALTEAHEKAVVRGQEKSQFFHLLESGFVRSHVAVEVTRKAMSKRTRGV